MMNSPEESVNRGGVMSNSLRIAAMMLWACALTPMLVVSLSSTERVSAQESESSKANEEADRESIARYEQILLARPQAGTALDKLFEFHKRQGTIDELCKRLEKQATAEEDGKAYQLLGLLQLRLGKGSESIANLVRAETLMPSDAFASLYLSKALSQERQYAKALTSLSNSAKRKPSQAVALEILDEVNRIKDRGISNGDAVEIVTTLGQAFPSNGQVLEKAATCLIELGHSNKAQPIFEKLVELTRDPLRKLEIRMQLALLMARNGQPEQALDELERLARLAKPQSWLHTALLKHIEDITEKNQGGEGLIQYYERSLREQPEDLSRMLRLATALRRQSQVDEAKTWIEKAIDLSPSTPDPYLAMAELWEEQGQYRKAAEVMRRLSEIYPANSDYIVRWGQLLAREANEDQSASTKRVEILAEAANVWRRLLVGHESDPLRAIQVAELTRRAAMQELAIEMYQQAIDASAGKLEFREMLGEYLVEVGRLQDAKRLFGEAIVSAGDSRDTLVRLSETLRRVKLTNEALLAMEKACQISENFVDLIQLADLQIENQRNSDAVATLIRASRFAETATDLTLVWDKQKTSYKKLSDLEPQSPELARVIRASEVGDAESLEYLAILQSARGQSAQAAATATALSNSNSESMRGWLLTARLQHEAGMSLSELESLSVLNQLDPKNATEYLQRIATIHFQLNQIDQALSVMEQVLSSPSANLQHFQMAAAFCLQTKNINRAIEFLRRATQVFPNDRGSWLILARQLMEVRDYLAASDAVFRVLELSKDQSQQKEAVELLLALPKAVLNVERLVERLRRVGVERNREAEADTWVSWVLLERGDVIQTKEFVSAVANRANATSGSLQTAVEMARRMADYAQAAGLQERLLRVEPSASNQLKLGEMIWLSGDAKAAETEWKKVMQNRVNDLAVVNFAKELLSQKHWHQVRELVRLGTELRSANWEFLTIGIFASIQAEDFTEAAKLSDELLVMQVAGDERLQASELSQDESTPPLTVKDRLAWLEYAGQWQSLLNVVDVNRSGYRTNQGNPRASQAAAVRHLAMKRGATLRSSPLGRYSVQCLTEARALAVLTKFGKLNQQKPGIPEEFVKYVEDAIAAKKVEQLWDCVLVLEPANGRETSFNASGAIEYNPQGSPIGSQYRKVLDALLELGEPAAIELAVSEVVLTAASTSVCGSHCANRTSNER